MRVSNNVQSGGQRVARKKAVEDRNPSNRSEFAWNPRQSSLGSLQCDANSWAVRRASRYLIWKDLLSVIFYSYHNLLSVDFVRVAK